MECPCCSGKEYSVCCEPFHKDEVLPQTPELLMRSRYTAFSMNLTDYLVETTHPSKRPFHSKKEIDDWSKQNIWLKLEVVKAWDNYVHFKAYYQDNFGDFYEHEELSGFQKEGGKWYYVDGKFDL